MKKFCHKKQIIDETNDPMSCDYYDRNELNIIHTKDQYLYIIDTKICSVLSHMDDLKIFLSLSDINAIRTDNHLVYKRTLNPLA